MTINQIIGNNERRSKVDLELWKKLNEKYSNGYNIPENNNSEKEKLEHNLIYGSPKPIITLTPLTRTMVLTPTANDFDTLMQIYESANWKWIGGVFATSHGYWKEHQTDTCVSAGYVSDLNEGEFGCDTKCNFPKYQYTQLDLEDFCKVQHLTQDKINELNSWYNINLPNRSSKVQ
jgi:hypothetical protein